MLDRLREAAKVLLGVSAYQPPDPQGGPELDSEVVKRTRKALGGNIQPLPTTKLRWYLRDLETAQVQADAGHIREAARLYRAMRRDGVIAGLLGTRTSGLVRLPKRFYGDQEVCDALRARNGTRDVFDEMCPSAELGKLIADGIVLGVGVGELIPIPGRSFPLLVRLDPEFLEYQWTNNQWYFISVVGRIPITPGAGRWVLHIPGGRLQPWSSGVWPALGRSFINKEHAMLHRSNYSAKLANPAIAAVSPTGAAESERRGFFRKLLQWGVNTVFDVPTGWDVKIIESNGRGWDVFQKEIDTSDNEYMVTLAGQIVTTTGGAGFANADIHQSIRKDLVQDTGDAIAYTVNTQIMPAFALAHWGDPVRYAAVEWDTQSPADREKESRILGQVAAAIKLLDEALGPHALRVEAREIVTRYDIPVEDAVVPSVDMPNDDTGKDDNEANSIRP